MIGAQELAVLFPELITSVDGWTLGSKCGGAGTGLLPRAHEMLLLPTLFGLPFLTIRPPETRSSSFILAPVLQNCGLQ